jgi:hypothetical protein
VSKLIKNAILAIVIGCVSSCGGGGGGGSTAKAPEAIATDEDRIISVSSSGLSRLVADPVRPYVYVSDRAQSKVHFLNTGTYQIEKAVAVGAGPTQMEISGDGQLLFVMLTGASQVAVVDLISQTLVGTVDIVGTGVTGPTSISAGPGRLLYVGAGSFSMNPHVQAHDVSSLPAMQLQSFGGAGSNNVVSGATVNRASVFTQTNTTAPAVTQWSTASDPPTLTHTIAGLPYGGGTPGTATGCYMQSSADSTLVYAVTDGGTNGTGPADSGVIPAFRTSDGVKVGAFDTELTPNALALDTAGHAVATHSQFSVNRTSAPGHRTARHIHVYDSASFAELGVFDVSGYVTRNGMVITPGDAALVFLMSDRPDSPASGSNENTANRIGVIF